VHTHHHHDHAHPHGAPKDFGRAFVIAITLNLGFTAVEFVYGFLAQSSALMADAGHNLSDVLGLVLAWGGAMLARKAPDSRFTFGLRGSSILAALANAMFLLIACGAIGWDAIRRLADPPEVASVTVMVVAGIGVLINLASAWLFAKGSKGDLNIRGAFLHLAADAAVSVGVVLAGLAILYTGWNWLDPRGDRYRHLGFAARIPEADPQCGAREHRPRRGGRLASAPARRQRHPRPAHLGHEHHGERADRPSGDAGRFPRRRLAGPGGGGAA
jgi:Co/Zn/Cd efflux system component